MTDDLSARWADLVVDYCLRVEPGETILVGSEWEGRPLVEACYRALVLRGAHPLVRLDLPGLHEFFLGHATERNWPICRRPRWPRPRRLTAGSGSPPRAIPAP